MRIATVRVRVMVPAALMRVGLTVDCASDGIVQDAGALGPAWLSSMSVPDLDRPTAQVSAAGGKVLFQAVGVSVPLGGGGGWCGADGGLSMGVGIPIS